MTTSRLFLDDQKLIALYTCFQQARRSLGVIYPGVAYHDFVDSGSYDGAAGPAPMIASEHLVAAANTVNRFCYDMHALGAWEKVFITITEYEVFIAFLEFVVPIAANCLSILYSIKQMLTKSICHISHQTNRLCRDDWNELALKPDWKIRFEDAKKLATHFAPWPAVSATLSRLNDESFTLATDDYRNRLNHGFARRIELGHTMTIRRDPNTFVCEIYDAPPFRIGDLIPLLAKQYEAAVDCYNAYIELIREQHKLWLRPARNSG